MGREDGMLVYEFILSLAPILYSFDETDPQIYPPLISETKNLSRKFGFFQRRFSFWEGNSPFPPDWRRPCVTKKAGEEEIRAGLDPLIRNLLAVRHA